MNTVDSLEDNYAEQIKQCLSHTINAIVDAGHILTEAQDKLKAAWGEKTRRWTAFLKSKCNISSSYATKFMTISEHPVIGDSTYWPQLPCGVEVLYQLAVLFPKPEQFKERLTSGAITVNLTVEQAKALKPHNSENPPAKNNKGTVDTKDAGNSNNAAGPTSNQSLATATPDPEETEGAERQDNNSVAPDNAKSHSTRKREHSWKAEASEQQFYLMVAVSLTDGTASDAERKNWEAFVRGVHLASEEYKFPSVRFDGYPQLSTHGQVEQEQSKAA